MAFITKMLVYEVEEVEFYVGRMPKVHHGVPQCHTVELFVFVIQKFDLPSLNLDQFAREPGILACSQFVNLLLAFGVRTASISGTSRIRMWRGNSWSSLGLLVYNAVRRGLAMLTSNLSTKMCRAFTC